MDYDEIDSDLDLTEEDIENVAFEKDFYELVAGTIEFQILPIPNLDGSFLSNTDIKLIKKECKEANYKLLYRVSNGKIATVFDAETGLTGVMPEYDSIGFSC